MEKALKLNALKFALACSLSASLLWLICSILATTIPNMMLSMSGDMMHMQLNEMGWHLSLLGVMTGLIGWFVVAGATGGMLATIYNRLL
jgi:hypothetical protein